MKATRILAAIGLLAGLQLAIVGVVSAGDPFRVRLEGRDGNRMKGDVDVRDLGPDSSHSITLSVVSPSHPACTQTFDDLIADAAGELDLRTDTNVNDENNLDACFKGATTVNVKLDGVNLGEDQGNFVVTQK